MTKRNQTLRIKFNEALAENGVILRFVAKKVGIADTTLSRWRYGNLEFSEGHLKRVEEFLLRYE